MSQIDELLQAKEELMKEGLKSYPLTLLALKEFRANIQTSSRKILEGKLNDLSGAMRIPLSKDNISSHTNPDSIPGNYNGDYAWIAVKITIPDPYLGCYFGLTFNNAEMKSQATAMMETNNKKTATILLNKGNTVFPKFTNKSGNEVCVSINVEESIADSFEKNLDEAIKVWIDFWQKTGGVANLLK